MPFKPTDYLPYDFANRRHIGPSPAEMDEMLTLTLSNPVNATLGIAVATGTIQNDDGGINDTEISTWTDTLADNLTGTP